MEYCLFSKTGEKERRKLAANVEGLECGPAVYSLTIHILHIEWFSGHNDAVLCAHYRDQISLAVSDSADNSIKCWDTRTGSRR